MMALKVFNDVLLHASNPIEQALPITPFRFDPVLRDQPSRFEWHFVFNEMRYAFELALTSERIEEERLLFFPHGKESLLYERRHTSAGDVYQFGARLEGGALVHHAWQSLTNAKTLFLKQAAENSNEEMRQLQLPFHWLRNFNVFNASQIGQMAQGNLALAEKHPVFADNIAQFLQEIDVPITQIEFEKMPLSADLINAAKQKMLVGKSPQLTTMRTKLTHKTALGEADFELEEESEGTKNLIGFWLPWTLLMGTEYRAQTVMGIDEINNSLHPNIVIALLHQHMQRTDISQLIFTTHDTHLMDAKLLRRDQFWLTERDANGATQLRSIHDFVGRESEDIEKRYYEGRYRALPIVRRN